MWVLGWGVWGGCVGLGGRHVSAAPIVGCSAAVTPARTHQLVSFPRPSHHVCVKIILTPPPLIGATCRTFSVVKFLSAYYHFNRFIMKWKHVIC